MKKKMFLVIAIFFYSVKLFSQSWNWFEKIYSSSEFIVKDITSSDSLIFVCGTTYNNIQFLGTTYYINPDYNGYTDSWILCANENKNVKWFVSLSGCLVVNVEKILFKDSSLYVAGFFKGDSIFVNTNLFKDNSLQPSTVNRVFILKLSKNGEVENFKIVSYTTQTISINSLDANTLSLFISGCFTGRFDIYNGLFYNAIGTKDNYYVLQLTKDLEYQNFIYSFSSNRTLVTSGDTCIYVSVQFSDSCKVNQTTIYNNGTTCLFFAYDILNNQYLWTKLITSSNFVHYDFKRNNGRLYLSGKANSITQLPQGDIINGPFSKAVIAMFSENNGNFIGIHKSLTSGTTAGKITFDRNNSLYCTIGFYNDTLIFNGDTLLYELLLPRLVIFKISGEYNRYRKILTFSSYQDITINLANIDCDYTGNVYVAGNFKNNLHTDSLFFSINNSTSYYNGYFGKIACTPPRPIIIVEKMSICPYDSSKFSSDIISQYYKHIWSNGVIGNYIYVKDSIDYYVFREDENGCRSETSHAKINVYTLPQLLISNHCDSITINDLSYNANYWIKGYDTLATNVKVLYTQDGGYFKVELIDTNNCIVRDSVYHWGKVKPLLTRLCDTIRVDTLIASPFYFKSGANIIGTDVGEVIYTGAGYVRYEVVDSNGCYLSDSVYHWGKVKPLMTRLCDTIRVDTLIASPFYFKSGANVIGTDVGEVIYSGAGYVRYEVVDSNGCYLSDSIYHHKKITPQIKRICDTLYALNIDNVINFYWDFYGDTIHNKKQIIILNGGTYLLVAIDSNLCEYTISRDVFIYKKDYHLNKLCNEIEIKEHDGIAGWYYNYQFVQNSENIIISEYGDGAYYAVVQDSSGCIIYTDTLVIDIFEWLKNIKVYPIPARDIIFIQKPVLTTKVNNIDDNFISILDNTGKTYIIQQSEKEESITTIDNCPTHIEILKYKIESLPAGVYVINIFNKYKNISRVLIKN